MMSEFYPEPDYGWSTVYEYMYLKLGVYLDMEFNELDIDTPCGQDCKKVIDAGVALIELCDPFPKTVGKITAAVTAQCEILYFG